MQYLATTTWQVNEKVDIEVGYGIFNTKEEACEYGNDHHKKLYLSDEDEIILILKDGQVVVIPENQCWFRKVKEESAHKIFWRQSDFEELHIKPTEIRKLERFFKFFESQAYSCRSVCGTPIDFPTNHADKSDDEIEAELMYFGQVNRQY